MCKVLKKRGKVLKLCVKQLKKNCKLYIIFKGSILFSSPVSHVITTNPEPNLNPCSYLILPSTFLGKYTENTHKCTYCKLKYILFVTLDHKTSLKCQFFEIEIYMLNK